MGRAPVIRAMAAVMLVFLASCGPWPTRDPQALKVLRAEALVLMDGQPADNKSRGIPASHWPPGIAALRPKWIWAARSDVVILVDAEFDDHWGYYIPRNPHERPHSDMHRQELAPGVFWIEP